MRQIFTLISCLSIFFIATAQTSTTGNNVIMIRCLATPVPDKPLLVIDGIIENELDLKKIDPNSIESIYILKNPSAQAVFGCWAYHGAIIITTKIANQRVIRVNDMLTGEALPDATIELLYKENEKDVSLSMKTDSVGCLITNKIVNGKEYELRVSSVGYKTFTAHVNSKIVGKNYSVSLERNYSILDEVVITSDIDYTRRRLVTCVLTRVDKAIEQKVPVVKDLINLFPNPTTRLQKVTIEYNTENEKKLTLRLFSLDSKLISSKEHFVTKGITRIDYPIDSQLAAGLYIIQIFDVNDKLIRSEKLIIQ